MWVTDHEEKGTRPMNNLFPWIVSVWAFHDGPTLLEMDFMEEEVLNIIEHMRWINAPVTMAYLPSYMWLPRTLSRLICLTPSLPSLELTRVVLGGESSSHHTPTKKVRRRGGARLPTDQLIHGFAKLVEKVLAL